MRWAGRAPPTLLVIAVASLAIGAATFGVFVVDEQLGADYRRAQTTAVSVLALGQMAYLFSCRFLGRSALTRRVLTGNRLVWVACGALAALQLLFVYAPFMHAWFGSGPLHVRDWALALGGALVVFAVTEAAKALARRTDRPS